MRGTFAASKQASQHPPVQSAKASASVGATCSRSTSGDSTDATPDNEQSMRLYDNGIVGLFDFDFMGGVKIRATLDSLKLQPTPGC